MSGKNGQRHCSDDALIAHADGELSRREEQGVAAHLKQCWECRARLGELEEAARDLARKAVRFPFGGAGRAAAAKAALLTWRRQFERDRVSGQRLWPRWSSLPVATLAAVVLLLAALALWSNRFGAQVRPRAALARAQQFERALAQAGSPRHQLLNLEVRELSPPGRSSRAQLEVWWDGRGHRYGSRWTGAGGRLRHAVWQPRAGRAWHFDDRVARGARPVAGGGAGSVSLINLEARRFEEFESTVWDWMRRRPWRPVEVTEDFARFVARGGVTLEARRHGAENGRPVLRLTALHSTPLGAVEFLLEMDPDSYRPRLQQATCRTAGRVFIVRLSVARDEAVSLASVPPTVFEPEAALLPSASKEALLAPIVPLAPAKPGAAPPPSVEAELEAMFTLHRLGSCTRTLAVVESGDTHAASESSLPRRLAPPPSELSALRISHGLARELTGLIRAALGDALALQNLAEWAVPERTAELGTHGWRLLDVMVRDHVAGLRGGVARSRSLAERLLARRAAGAMVAPPHASPSVGETWRADALCVFAHLQRADRRLRELLAEPADPQASLDRAAAEILTDLPTAEQELGWLEREWIQALRGGLAVASRSGSPSSAGVLDPLPAEPRN